MKTRSKVLLIAGAVIAAAAAWFAWTVSPMAGVTSTGAITPMVWAIKDGMANLFIVRDGNSGTTIAIDAGMDPATVQAELARIGIDPATVQAVFFTHGDADHTGGLTAFGKAAMVLPEAEVAMVDGSVPRRMLGMELRGTGFPVPYETIKADEIRSAGGLAVRAIATPGHTAGSTSYLVNGSLLFTGDLLILRGGKAEVLWSFINNDTAQSERSIRQLATREGVSLLATAHSGFSADFAGAMAAFR
jgi:glyoxylase-like metal-dependent hydrolase (beta-lactamase superfamily II)